MKAKIQSKQATYTLERLHAELAGKIIDNKREAERLRRAMVHVEAVLKLLSPDYDVRPIAVRRRKVNTWFKRGTLLRHALAALRTAEGPLTTREVVLRMLTAKGVTNATPFAIRGLCVSTSEALRTYNGRSVVSDGKVPARWSVAV